MKNKNLKIILKIILSVAALYYVATSLDFFLIKEAIESARPGFLILALMLYAMSQIAAAIRLNCFFRQIALTISSFDNIKLYWLGLFYNLFLPGGVGGDGFKVYWLGRHTNSPIKKIIGVILSDRISGLSIIVIILIVLTPGIEFSFPFQQWVWALFPLIGLLFYLFLHFFNKSLTPAFTKVMGWALVVQAFQMFAAFMILQSLSVKLTDMYLNYIFLFFLSAIMGSIPITLGGIGAREITFLIGAKYLGINETYAVALSILFYAASAITAFPGIIYSFNPTGRIKLPASIEKTR